MSSCRHYTNAYISPFVLKISAYASFPPCRTLHHSLIYKNSILRVYLKYKRKRTLIFARNIESWGELYLRRLA